MTKKRISFSDEPFSGLLLGVVCQLKDYQVCWHLNKVAGFNLVRMNDLEVVQKKKNKTSVFSYYRYENELDKWNAYLISNRHAGDSLVPEVKQADYFLLIRGEVSSAQSKDLMQKLKTIPAIQLVVELDFNTLKSRKNLVLD